MEDKRNMRDQNVYSLKAFSPKAFSRYAVCTFFFTIVFFFSACKNTPPQQEALAPREIQPPEFSITNIAILKAELINTRFRVGMKIDNPNAFPVELSALRYTLYGNGMFWADGDERSIIEIPAQSSVTGNMLLLMNFTGMKRDLLDQIINLSDVQYRFTGSAQISSGDEHLPTLAAHFDLSGFSPVLEK
ncbi:MAG: LEA type 2 family protein [Treponema sp.]|nr:LEA type 2 family protein [Treponema sp.]